jgi:imidazole glycerol-phosphate synthase subunit HisH
MRIAVIDYEMGNLRSVTNAFNALGSSVEIVAHPEQLRVADAVVLPGVGAFGDGIRNLRERGFVDALDEEIRTRGKAFLGLCLGMQLLATTGTEHGSNAGLGWIPGGVRRLEQNDSTLRIPHIGWNDVRFTTTNGLYAGLGESQTFYFAHSYVLDPEDPGVVSGLCDYGSEFVASIEMSNIFGTQFHPEKSQKAGLAVLGRFLDICSRRA